MNMARNNGLNLPASLKRMHHQRIESVALAAPSPFALALMVERFREKITTEKLKDSLDRIICDAGKAVHQ